MKRVRAATSVAIYYYNNLIFGLDSHSFLYLLCAYRETSSTSELTSKMNTFFIRAGQIRLIYVKYVCEFQTSMEPMDLYCVSYCKYVSYAWRSSQKLTYVCQVKMICQDSIDGSREATEPPHLKKHLSL